jgi:hypothetical protein
MQTARMPGQARYIHTGDGEERKQFYFSAAETGKGVSQDDARRSHGMAGGPVAEVCCSIVAGVRWKKRFLEVGGPWEVGAGAGLRTSAED